MGGIRGWLTEVVGCVEAFDFGGAFDAGGGGAARVVRYGWWVGSWARCAYINPRLILPAMVYFSRCGMLSGHTMIQGKMAKKKSTKMVETVQARSAHFSIVEQVLGQHTAQNVRRRPRVDGTVATRDAAVVDKVEGDTGQPETKHLGC